MKISSSASPAANREIVLPMVEPGAVLTMINREIAERTGKQHKNVMRNIRTMMSALSMGSK